MVVRLITKSKHNKKDTFNASWFLAATSIMVAGFEVIEDYQAESWWRPRRIVAKIEIDRHGVNRRFVVVQPRTKAKT